MLYVYRVLLTGIHLMRTGRVEANLLVLNEEFRLPYIPELAQRKVHGSEKEPLGSSEAEFHRREYERLAAQLECDANDSHLPNEPQSVDELNDLLIRVRLGTARL